MELFLFHADEYSRLYNCSLYKIEDVPLERRQHKLLGILLIIIGVFCELCYLPCIWAMRTRLDNPAYKFMLSIGLGDLVGLAVSGPWTGYLAIEGASFCSHPTPIYVSGTVALFAWGIECSAAVALAINRCVEMRSSFYADLLYRGWRCWLWLAFIWTYGFCFFYFTKPIGFSGVYLAWFFNPHAGYNDNVNFEYTNYLHTINNCVTFSMLIGVYTVFMIVLAIRSSNSHKSTAMPTRKKFQRNSFLQVFLISLVTLSAATIYLIMQFVRINEIIIIIGTFLWLFGSGMPAFIYLSLNKSIRRECTRMFTFESKRLITSSAVGPQITTTESDF